MAQVVISCIHKVTERASWDIVGILWNEFQLNVFFEEFPCVDMILPFLLPHRPPQCGNITLQIGLGKFHDQMSPHFGNMNVGFHICKPSIYNRPILNPIKIPKLNRLETYPFRWSSFEGNNQIGEIEFILSKTSNYFGVKRTAIGCSSSFSWSPRMSRSSSFSESFYSSFLMASVGTSRSWVGSSTMVSCIGLWDFFGVIRILQ